MTRIIYLSIVGFFCINTALAESTPWTDSVGGRARILLESYSNINIKERRGTIEIDLKPLWKTYWSNPGNTGMAPSLTINKKITAKILFPVPEQILGKDEFNFGYHGHILLPFKFVLPENDPQKAKLIGSATIGVCKNLCIPMQIPFEFPLNQEGGDFQSDALVDLAFSQLPTPPTKSFFIKKTTIVDGRVFVTLIHPQSQIAPQLFLDGGETQIGPAIITTMTPITAQFVAPILQRQQGQKYYQFDYIATSNDLSISGDLNTTAD